MRTKACASTYVCCCVLNLSSSTALWIAHPFKVFGIHNTQVCSTQTTVFAAVYCSATETTCNGRTKYDCLPHTTLYRSACRLFMGNSSKPACYDFDQHIYSRNRDHKQQLKQNKVAQDILLVCLPLTSCMAENQPAAPLAGCYNSADCMTFLSHVWYVCNASHTFDTLRLNNNGIPAWSHSYPFAFNTYQLLNPCDVTPCILR